MDRFITALIIDDDFSARNILQKFLEVEEKVQIIACMEDTSQACEFILKNSPDVVFLDINMPYESGIRFAYRLKACQLKPLLVFTTAFQNYALEAFDLKPFDFLVKPFGISEISSLINRIESHLDSANNKINLNFSEDKIDKLKFRNSMGYLFLLPCEIIYIRSVRNNSELFLTSGNFEKVNMPISEIFREIFNKNFLLINRSVIINMNYIDKIDRKQKKCLVSFKKQEYEFPVSQKNLNFFENLKTVKLG
jgi:two-component system, LytTR family, response regulator